MNKTINTAALGRWIRTWIQPNGAIYGFHNHSVWGGNPYRWSEFSSGHSTWSSPFLSGLAYAVTKHSNADAEEQLRTLVRFQATSFQDNGNFKHIGFQVGDVLDFGLIHNACPLFNLGYVAYIAPDVLGDELMDLIRKAFDRNKPWHERMVDNYCTNQEYARILGALYYTRAFNDDRFLSGALEDLDKLIELSHLSGIPHEGCAGTYRHLSDKSALEPAEYYGMMIMALLQGYEISGEQRYLDAAGEICRHVSASAWTDRNGCLRFHRLWCDVKGKWTRTTTPMLVSGMGFTMDGIRSYLAHRHEDELAEAADKFDATYAYYQHESGFFAAATGWQSEVDVAPSTAWHCHDFRYLAQHSKIDDDFWKEYWSSYDRVAVVLGDQCLWVEDGPNWAIADYHWQDVFDLKGRKDRSTFGRDMAWIGGPNALPEDYNFKTPSFMKLEDSIVLHEGLERKIDVLNLSSLTYVESN